MRLFSAVAAAVPATEVLYPGSFVDIAASFVFPSVTYVDNNRRAVRFFSDQPGVERIIDENRTDDGARAFLFLGQDYREELAVEPESVDLLVSLYAGFISEACTRYLRIGGTLLVNPSHGDAAMAAIDPRYRLAAVVKSGDGDYRVDDTDLDRYLIPKKPQTITPEFLHEHGRGIGYTRSPFAYLFERIA
ncbi:MAG: hypothetical protein AAF531_20920 [Actinomycetota bacterium]